MALSNLAIQIKRKLRHAQTHTPLPMGKEGSMMMMMKNNAIWKTITEHGTLKPGH